MATATHSTAREAGRRRGEPFAAAVMTPELRAEIAAKIEALMEEGRRALEGAHFLIGFLDAADRPTLDMEPSLGWEASAVTGRIDAGGYHQTTLAAGLYAEDREDEAADEASAQPAGLNPHQRPAVHIHRPTRREMAAAYRRIGAPVPAHLRGGFLRGCAA